MNPYLLTLMFLTLMSVLTSSEVARFAQSTLGSQLHSSYQESLAVAEGVKAIAAFEDFRLHAVETEDEEVSEKKKKPAKRTPSSKPRRSTSLGYNFERPPNNSRLNLYLMLYTTPHQDYPLSPYEVVARLMRHLYAEATFFNPGIEYAILDALIACKEEAKSFTFPDELATLDLGDPTLQMAFYHMLKGAEGCPSLLNFITFDHETRLEKKKVNLLFAAPCVIEALLNDDQVVEKLLTRREALWEKIFDHEAHRLERPPEKWIGRNQLKKELKADVTEILAEAGLDYAKHYKWVFDMGLGELGNILFIEDPQTGFIRREKYVSFKNS